MNYKYHTIRDGKITGSSNKPIIEEGATTIEREYSSEEWNLIFLGAPISSDGTPIYIDSLKEKEKAIKKLELIQQGVEEIEKVFPGWKQRSTAFDMIVLLFKKAVENGWFPQEEVSALKQMIKVDELKSMREVISTKIQNLDSNNS